MADATSRFTVSVDFADGTTQDLWFCVSTDLQQFTSADRLDYAALCLTPTAMLIGEDIHIEGVLSENFAWSLNERAIPVLTMVPTTPNLVQVTADEYAADTLLPAPTISGMGFSGGVDSFSVLAEMNRRASPAAPGIDALVFNNFSNRRYRLKEWNDRSAGRISQLASSMGLRFVRIDSNIAEINRVAFGYSNTCLNVSGALFLQRLFCSYVVACGFQYPASRLPIEDMGQIEPQLISTLSTPTTAIIQAGSKLDRIGKTKQLLAIPETRQFLDVCFETGSGAHQNCGKCSKCQRTLLTLEILGRLEEYADCFNLEAYRRSRPRYLAEVAFSQDIFPSEVRKLARENNWRLPLPEVWRGVALNWKQGIGRVARRVIRPRRSSAA